MAHEIVGFCRGGAGKGLYVLLTSTGQLGDHSERCDLFFSGAIRSEDLFPGDAVSLDCSNRGDRLFLESLLIEEVPQPWSGRIKASLFESDQQTGSISEGWNGTGRFIGVTALSERVRMIALRSDERAQAFATAATLDARAIADRVTENAELFNSLSLFLAASGLSLAIVPSAPSITVENEVPWLEFGRA